MGPGDVSLICYFGGKLIDDDKNAKYIGGTKKGASVPNNIGFASFKERVQEILKTPLNGMKFNIKCGVRFDEFTVIGMDVDDDQSLRFVMDRSKFIMAYILEHLPTATIPTAIQRAEDVFPSRAATKYISIHRYYCTKCKYVSADCSCVREDLVLPSAVVQFQVDHPIDGTGNHKSIEMEMIGLNPPGKDVMNTNKGPPWSESKFIEWFPNKLLPFITGYKNPEGDGNCGFRALCMALGRDESEWAWMRDRLVKEIESNNQFYNMLLGPEEAIKLVERIWHLEGWAPCSKWMDMPSTGFIFAQAFKVVLVHYAKENCWTFVPSLSSPNTDGANVKVVGIGLVENDHYIKLDFQYGCPLPPFPHVPSNWRTICSATVNSWEVLLAPRLRACMTMNVTELEFDKCVGETVIIDGFSEPNADYHDGGIYFPISYHAHQEDNEENVPQNSVYEENQVTSQMEQNVPLLDVDMGSSDNCFALGREFPDIDALRNALSDMAVLTRREYEHVRTSPSKLKMKCKAEDCKWSIQASRLSNSPAFKVVKYQEVHTCMIHTKGGEKDHPQATVRWILSKVESSLEKDPNMEPSKIVKEMKDRYLILVSYNKAVKAKTKALEVMRSRLKEKNSLPDLDICCALKVELERGGTTICKLGVNSDGGSFQHFFWSFKACIDALRNHLRPVVYVGMVPTRTGVLMYARGIDGDGFYGNPIEVGLGFYFTEDEKSWETFLDWLKEFVLPPKTAAGNFNNSIPFSIVTEFEETALTLAVENVLPHLHHFFHSDYFAIGFSKKFQNDEDLLTLFYKACGTFSTGRCEAALQEMKSLNEEAYSWLSSVGSKRHWVIAFSPNKHIIDKGLGGLYLYFDLTLNEKSSIVEIVVSSRDKVAKYFSERRMRGTEAAGTTGLTPHVHTGFVRGKYALGYNKVESTDVDKYQVKANRGGTYAVDLEEKSCTCGQFQATEYPCDHAMVTIAHLNLDVRNYLSHQWFSLDTYVKTYEGNLPPPIPDDISQWKTALAKIPPKRTGVGRPRKLQKNSV